MENFNQKAHQAISESQQLALKNHNQQVDGEHLHAALLDQSDGLIPRLMQLIGVDASRYKGRWQCSALRHAQVQRAAAARGRFDKDVRRRVRGRRAPVSGADGRARYALHAHHAALRHNP